MRRFAVAAAAILLGGFPAVAGEEQSIARLVADAAKAMSEFPKSRDSRSVLRYYATDFEQIIDGRTQTRAGVEKQLADINENVSLGNPVGIAQKVTNVKAKTSGAIGWATYDFSQRLEALGEVLDDSRSRCSGIYRKTGDVWLIQHEHCSTLRAEAAPGGEAAPPAAKK